MGLNTQEDRITFRTVGGKKNFTGRLSTKMKIHKIEKTVEVFVVDDENFEYDILLGLDTIKNFCLKQDYDLKIYQKINSENKEDEIKYFNTNTEIQEYLINFNEGIPIDQFEAKLDYLPKEKKEKIQNLIDKHETTFARNKFDVAPVTLAYKREEGTKTRLCIDFRDLNKLLIPEPQPFPLIEEIIAKTRDAEWFTTLDINSAFWAIPLRAKDRYKTAFVTQEGHWQWKSLPFGLKTSPAIFQRILSNIIRRNGLNSFCINYIDDILVFSRSFEEHVEHLERLLEAIRKEGFRLKFTKCKFAKNEAKYLGHVISKNTVRPLRDNLRPIQEFPRPDTRKKIRQFLGKINFYHKYIEDSARLLEPLYNLLRKDTSFSWSQDCERAFTKAKDLLGSQPTLAIYDMNAPTIIYTDASIDGIGAVLKQKQPDGELKPVAFFSKKLHEYQKKRKAIFLECLAIQEAIKYWQYWLIRKKLLVITDHKPLEGQNI
ncbi:hypothetical protein KPH14_000920 [Odynerus spinipes]|uniref:RNA-directed DNA polymerase n=1 Tax=Odynerus spinipes TaxID=1348599 RepID=A0AAD9RGF8_9HYME|nr:hypothetical protein KPH14_000920 [Odynerus spinipes]